MFRRKDSDGPGAGDANAETGFSRAGGGAEGKGASPEIPRRQVDLPTAPGSTKPATRSDAGAARAASSAEKRLIVGQGIKLSGEITACDLLVVEGHVEVKLNETKAVEIAENGRFVGSCEVEDAEISGDYEGELTCRGRLMVRGSGRLKGNVRYGELELERGGRISGNVTALEDGVVPPSTD